MARVAVVAIVLVLTTVLLRTDARQSTGGKFRELIDKHNFGAYLKAVKQLSLSVGTANVVFYFKLPQRKFNLSLVQVNCSKLRTDIFAQRLAGISYKACENIYGVVRSTHDLKLELFEYIERKMDHVYELLLEVPELDSPKRSWWTSAWSWVTGLAKNEDVEKMQKTIKNVETGVVEAATAWESGSSEFVAALELQTSRTDNLYKIIDSQRSSFEEFHKKILEFLGDDTVRQRVLGHTLITLKEFVLQVSEIDMIYNGVLDLLAGRLSHNLLDHRQLNRSLQWLQSELDANNTGLVILRQDPRYYFEEAKFKLWSHRRHLLITLKVPLTTRDLRDKFTLYSIHTVPLASPTRQRDHYTELNVDVEAIIYNKDSDFYILVPELASVGEGDLLLLQTSDLVLRDRRRTSCALSLIEGSLEDIKLWCGYSIIASPLPTSVFKIDEHTVLTTNVEQVMLKCPSRNYSQQFMHTDLQVAYRLRCGCELRVKDYYLVESALYCQEDDGLELLGKQLFVLNLPYLSHFVNHAWINTLQADVLLNFSVEAQLPDLAIDDAKRLTKELLAQDKGTRLDLAAVLNKTKTSTRVYGSVASYLMDQILQANENFEAFDLFDWYTWVQILSMLTTAFTLFLTLRLYPKVKALYVLVATLERARAELVPTHLTYLTSTAPVGQQQDALDLRAIITAIKDVLPADVTMLICLTLSIISLLAYLMYKRREKEVIKSHLYLQVGNAVTSVQLPVLQLDCNVGSYTINVETHQTRFTIEDRRLYSLLTWGAGIQISNHLVQMPIDFETRKMIPIWTASRLHRVLSGEHYALLLLLNNRKKLLQVLLLKYFSRDIGDPQTFPSPPATYPPLPKY